eukprot:m.3585 g.3585  ORF g.3585 m.3585 type:complete len:110 (+) comp6145_c0_seq1:41-370(+)
MPFEAHVQEPWFSHIKAQRKRFEGRLQRDAWLSLAIGSEICFVNGSNSTTAIVANLHCCTDFGEAFDRYGQDLLPNVLQREQAVDIYGQFYSSELVAQHGVLVVELRWD